MLKSEQKKGPGVPGLNSFREGPSPSLKGHRMKTLTLFGFKFTVEHHYRYEVHLHAREWPIEFEELHRCKTLPGAVSKAFLLSRNRNQGWCDRMVAVVFDRDQYRERFAFLVSEKVRYVTRFVRL